MDEPKKPAEESADKPVDKPVEKPVERRKNGDDREVVRVRHPLTLRVDKIEIEPEVDNGGVVRMAYDIMLYEYDMRKLHKALKENLEKKVIVPLRVRVIGRLES